MVSTSGEVTYRPGSASIVARSTSIRSTTHSIVDTSALAIRPVDVVIHSGDFKIDRTPIDGKPPDLQTLADYGSRGVLLLLSDSTNAEMKGWTGSESEVRGGLEGVFADAPGKIFFSTFSSHIHRIQQVLELSAATGRRVGVVGRSLLNTIKIATDLGHLRVPPSTFAELGELRELPLQQVTLLTSGSQGEPLSALTRIAMNDHAHVKVEPGDTVVLSSRKFPATTHHRQHDQSSVPAGRTGLSCAQRARCTFPGMRVRTSWRRC
jgi:ribonuclease J